MIRTSIVRTHLTRLPVMTLVRLRQAWRQALETPAVGVVARLVVHAAHVSSFNA
jgi:hypothetical protein